MPPDIHHDRQGHRFETRVEGHDCVLDYQLASGLMTITHTGVPASLGGRGIAGQLARFALDEARAKGWKVVPACSYVQAWIDKHPDYQDLVAEE